MAAPKAKKITKDGATDRGIQFVVFAPINADPTDEENFIYMVCPSSLKVVKVIEKYGDDADKYLELLGRSKRKSSHSSATFIDDLGDAVDVDDSLVEDGSGYTASKAQHESDDVKLDSFVDLDEDIISYAGGMSEIFPTDNDSDEGLDGIDPVDMADALELIEELDREDDDPDADFSDFSSDDGDIPSL